MYSIPDKSKSITNPSIFFQHAQDAINDIDLTEEDIHGAIQELKPNSVSGPDGVPTFILLKCAEALACPLYLWHHSLNTGIAPTEMKKAVIIPVHKGGSSSKGSAKKYWPVLALTSHIMKTLEKVE